VVANCITIRGSFVGTRQDMAEALAFAAAGKVKADFELQPLSGYQQNFRPGGAWRRAIARGPGIFVGLLLTPGTFQHARVFARRIEFEWNSREVSGAKSHSLCLLWKI